VAGVFPRGNAAGSPYHVNVLTRRAESDDPVAAEREALAAQRAALEDLKRQLAERVNAVKERENELRAAIARVAAGKDAAIALPPVAGPDAERLAARTAALAERERALAAREAALAEGNGASLSRDVERRERELAAGMAELETRERALAERERDPTVVRITEIEARLDKLRDAEEAFLRTRRELADRSDAVSARERLIAQRERELDEREDGWGGPDMHELEARLRKLESQHGPLGRTASFSGGFKKLEQEGTRRPPGS
jgi:hypothetical protein